MATKEEPCEAMQQMEAALRTKQDTIEQLQVALSSREAEIEHLREKIKEKDDLLNRLKPMIGHTTKEQAQDSLSSRDEEINRLSEKVKELENLLQRRKEMIGQTQKERDQLRRQNSELTNTLAQVGRQQSTNAIFPSPSSSPSPSSPIQSRATFSRRSLVNKDPLPPLPPTTETKEKEKREEGESDTDYSDMEDSAKENVPKKQKQSRKAENGERRSPSPSAQPSSIMSKPKPIIRNTGKSATPPGSSGVTLTSPKRSVGFPGLSSISEEGKNNAPQLVEDGVSSKDRSETFTDSSSSIEVAPRRRVTMSAPEFDRPTSKRRALSGEAEDVLGEKETVSTMRSRVSTVSSSNARYKGIGRKSSRQLKEEAAKLSERVMNNRRSGRKVTGLEFISPDMELKVREKICRAIGEKYGGLLRANRAATTIQTAYRQYKMKKRYDEIRKEASTLRKRAMSMTHPRSRKPTLVRRDRPLRYQRQITALAANDPLMKARLLSRELGKESIPHTSGRRHLVEQKRSERALSASNKEAAENKATEVDKNANRPAVEMETAVCEIKLEDVEATPPFSPDGGLIAAGSTNETTGEAEEEEGDNGLPSSFSTDVLLTPEGYQRPLSIFSVRPSVSMDASLATSEDREVTKSPAESPLPPDIREKKIIMGIGHFNRKPTRGIQYLVKERVLPDNPQHVATFLAKQYGLSKEKIGEFVGEISSEFHMAVLEYLLEQMDMKDKPIDEALRDFQILFRMPGEAQKIDKIMQMFALEYFRFNRDGVIKSEDAAYILAFAIMMLHTSLFNRSVKNRTTKKQWVSMNRGCNDDENFPEDFLTDIYDRVSKREFMTGQDHTTEVCDIERNLIGWHHPTRLASPQRRLMYRTVVTEIDQLTSRPSIKRRRRRILLLFSDQVIICKRRGGEQMEYRGSFTLMDAIAISFETHHYKNGVQIYSSHDEKAIFQCNCDSSDERVKLLQTLETTISELRELDKDRMADLGTTITKTQKDSEPEQRHRMASRAGDLLSSAQLNKTESVHVKRQSQADFVSGVGDLALSSGVSQGTIIRRTSKSSGTASPENRTSGGSHESGYDSQRTTPVPSPSPTNPTNPPNSVPSSRRSLQPRSSTTSAPMTLMAPAVPVTRSRSTDQIHLHRVMTITPTLTPETKTKFSSAEDVSAKSPKSPRSSKKKGKVVKKSRLQSLTSPLRLKISSRRGSSPNETRSASQLNGRPRTFSKTPSPPPPPSDLELSTQSVGSRSKTSLVTST